MTFKRTPGKWDWKLIVDKNGEDRTIFIDESGKEIHPTMGDVILMAGSPEMHSLLWQVSRELYETLCANVYKTEADAIKAFNLYSKVSHLLACLNIDEE